MALLPNRTVESSPKLSRGQFLRNSVITASGIVLLPAIFSSCKKYEFLLGSGPGKGWGGVPTQLDLQKAAANLIRMQQWLIEVYHLGFQYESKIFQLLGSTRDNSDWTHFIGNLYMDIGIGITDAIAEANPSSPALPALACMSNFLKDWNAGNGTPHALATSFEDFLVGHTTMDEALAEKLNSLADPASNYSNLLTQWKDVIEFNGKSYTLSNLADSVFPGPGDEYNKLLFGAFTHYKKSLWNLVIMKCCTYYENHEQYPLFYGKQSDDPTPYFYRYVQNEFYPKNKGVYVRGKFYSYNGKANSTTYELIYYNLGIGGYPLPDAAAAELFIDDTPVHVINPAGLWKRSDVFKQFSVTKYEFKAWELATYPNGNLQFNDNETYEFTGGLFPRLIQ